MGMININYRSKRRQIFHPSFTPNSPQVMRTGQTVSSTGASVAIRPPRSAIRRMNTRGQGTVEYF